MLKFRSNRRAGFSVGMINPAVHTTFRPHFGMYFKTQLLETSKGRDLGLFFSSSPLLLSHLILFRF